MSVRELVSDEPDLLLNVRKVAELLDSNERSVRRFHSRGQLPGAVRVGNRLVRFRARDLLQWIDDGCPRIDVTKGECDDVA